MQTIGGDLHQQYFFLAGAGVATQHAIIAAIVLGLALGVTGALFGASVIRGLLFGVPPRDPVTFAGVALMMAVIGLAACWIPARRASRIDPAITMRA